MPRILLSSGLTISPPGHNSQSKGLDVPSHEQYADISNFPALSKSEGHSSDVSWEEAYSYSRQEMSGNRGDGGLGVGDDSPPGQREHPCVLVSSPLMHIS